LAIIKQTFRPPSCKINKKTLEKIMKLLEKEKLGMKKDDEPDPDFII